MGNSRAWRWIAGGAVVAGGLLLARTGGSQNVRACREAVTVDDNGAPRNAAGHVRNCWPGDRGCTCDRDGDCYAGAGYTPCRPLASDGGATTAGGGIDHAPAAAPAPAAPVAESGYGGSFVARPGRARARLRVAGIEREMTVYAPRSRGAAPPLVLLFHGTNGTGDVAIDESGAQAMADGAGAVVIAPDARWMPQGDWDHATEETYWQTAPETHPARNADLLLVQAIMTEARLRFGVDPARVYAFGHSNGGFFATLVATQLSARIAAFATSSAGLVRCATTRSCRFEGRGASCAALRAQRGWCRCEGPDRPGEVATVGRLPPAYLTHGTRDPLVSVQYTCALAERLQAAGAAVSVVLRDGDGHAVPPTFARDAWAFVAGRRLP